MSYIEIQNVQKYYKKNKVLDVESLKINKNEIVAFLGKNGSGKSTLLKIISGVLYPSNGLCEIKGLKSTDKSVKDFSKFVLESGQGYYDYLTAWENIQYFLSLNNVNINDRNQKSKFELYVDKLLFREHLNKKVSGLSQGNRQKLSIIVMLMNDPEIICLDEPTNGLDISAVNLFMSILYEVCKNEHKTILFTTHDILFTKSLNARVIVMNEGKIILDKPSGELFENMEVNKTLIQISAGDVKKLEKLKHTKYEFKEDKILLSVYHEEDKKYIFENAQVFSVQTKPITLDDIFFKVISNV